MRSKNSQVCNKWVFVQKAIYLEMKYFQFSEKAPFSQTRCLHFMVPTLSTFLLSFPPLRKIDGKSQHEEVLHRFKITAHSEERLFFEGQLFFRPFSRREDRGFCRRFNTVSITEPCFLWCYCWVCDCFTSASQGSNPDRFRLWMWTD